ncbi:MAG: universal stress protein [Allosphingosinicella sp.]
MTESNTLLLASDLSARSDRPTDRALLLADQLSSSVLLLHVVEDQEANEEQLKERVRAALDSVAGEKAHSVDVVVRRGRVDREILTLAEECSPALIVTGVARFNSIRDYILGTAVDHLVRHAPAPVLVVKRRAREPYRRLLVATDFSECSARALRTAAALFPEAEITVWHSCHAAYEAYLNAEQTVIALQLEADREMKRFVESAALPEETRARLVQRVEVGRDLWSQAEKAVRDGAFDLFVLGTHGQSGGAQATIGSRAAELLHLIDCDMPMLRAPTR